MKPTIETACAGCDKPLSQRYVEKFLAPLPATPENIERAGVTCSSCTQWIAEKEDPDMDYRVRPAVRYYPPREVSDNERLSWSL